MNQLSIHVLGDELEAAAAFSRAEGIGFEVTAFAFPENLDNDLPGQIARHLKATAGITPLSSHGPCFDLVAASPDPAIVAVTRQRHDAALAASSEIGASLYVAHTLFTPLIRDHSYRANFARRMLDFWLPLADQAGKHNMVICLENMWEPEPDIQAEMITAGNHPHLRATFDNGHALIFSEHSSAQWVKTLGPVLGHCHLHDNGGQLDEHKAVGEGIENWEELVRALKKYAPDAILVAESEQLSENQLSITRLRDYGLGFRK
jgi:sugar phosphate isomerase/epimerase